VTESRDATDQQWDEAKPVAVPTSPADLQQLSLLSPGQDKTPTITRLVFMYKVHFKDNFISFMHVSYMYM